MELRPRVAITMGDAAGIGPEIIVKALADASVAARAIPLVLGEARVLERAMDATQVRLPIRTGTKPAMLLLLGTMRLMLFTNHMALRAVCDYVRKDRVLDRLVLAAAALRDLGIARPRLAVAGLNPHAGEEGAFGHEERDEIVPAIAAARARGIDAQGPFPADTVFLKARDGAFDLTLALYHDQGLMAVKLLGFRTVVTLLVGLPLIRTSTGHGTAFDIAGKNVADHRNLLEAVRVAAEIAALPRGAGQPGLAAAYGRAA